MAVVRSGNTFTIYKNGVQVGTRSAPTSVNLPNANFWIGKVDNFLVGSMDEVRVWNVARTQDQIISTMNSELAGTESGLVLNYHFNQGIAGGTNTSITSSSSAQIIDRRTNTATGTLRNFAGTGTVSNIVASTSATRTSVASFIGIFPCSAIATSRHSFSLSDKSIFASFTRS